MYRMHRTLKVQIGNKLSSNCALMSRLMYIYTLSKPDPTIFRTYIMKTHELVNLPNEYISDTLHAMKPKEHEKHARKIAKTLRLPYEETLLKVSSEIIESESKSDIKKEIYNKLFDMVQTSFHDEDRIAIKEITKSLIDKTNDNIDDKSKLHLAFRVERARKISILTALYIIILLTKTNLISNREAIKSDLKKLIISQQ